MQNIFSRGFEHFTEIYLVKDLKFDPKAEESNGIFLRKMPPSSNMDPSYYHRTQKPPVNGVFREKVDVRKEPFKHCIFVGIMDNSSRDLVKMLKADNRRIESRPRPGFASRRQYGFSLDENGPFYNEDWPESDRAESVIRDEEVTNGGIRRSYEKLRAGVRDAEQDVQEQRRLASGSKKIHSLENLRAVREYRESLEAEPPFSQTLSFKEDDENWAVAGTIKAIRRNWIIPGEEFYLYPVKMDEMEG